MSEVFDSVFLSSCTANFAEMKILLHVEMEPAHHFETRETNVWADFGYCLLETGFDPAICLSCVQCGHHSAKQLDTVERVTGLHSNTVVANRKEQRRKGHWLMKQHRMESRC